MKIVNFNNTKHTISFIPRLYIYYDLTLYLYNEITGTETNVIFDSYWQDGFMYIVFDFIFKKNDRVSFKIKNYLNEIIYRGKIISTIENPQEYKQITDLYEY